jgi:F-type H+-transporting ATPase subunit b
MSMNTLVFSALNQLRTNLVANLGTVVAEALDCVANIVTSCFGAALSSVSAAAYGAAQASGHHGAHYGAHSGAAVNIDLDWSFTLQMVLFAGLIVALKPLLLDPVLRVFEERENRTDGAKGAARGMQEQAGELLQRYDQELLRVNRAAADERDKMRAETARLENELVNAARASSAKILEDGRTDIRTQVDKIRLDLGRDAERLSREIAGRALGREVH